MIKKWYRKNKKLLIFFGCTTLITFLFTLLEINMVVSNAEHFDFYAKTKEMTDTLETVVWMGLLNIVLLVIWTLTLLFIILKVIFPNKRSVKSVFLFDEFKFLAELPSQLKKGIDKR